MKTRSVVLTVALVGLAGALALSAILYFGREPLTRIPDGQNLPTGDWQDTASVAPVSDTVFGQGVSYSSPTIAIDESLAADFDINDIENLDDMEAAYGVSFSTVDLENLSERKFVVKHLLDTSIRPKSGHDNAREFVQLYDQVKGDRDPRGRAPENAVFYSADVFFHAYNNLFTELLKEMENKTFYPAMLSLAENFFRAADEKAEMATTEADQRKWTKVRDYFAVPYVIFSTAKQPLTEKDYFGGSGLNDPASVAAEHAAADATADTYEKAAGFVEGLGLGAASQEAVLADLKTIYEAEGKGRPAVFAQEYADYAEAVGIDFKVDFSQFTPRGTYTSSSLRRQYFRGMKWYIMVPFFLKSPEMTTYAFAVSQLMAEQPEALKDYDSLESAIGFLVGKSDDLMPADYLQALAAAQGADDPGAAAMKYLEDARDPQIKDLAAFYPAIGIEQSDDVRLKTKGMRFFSGKFIIDSYWTGYLTQGDEALRPGYTQKLPPMASSLEVMALLGSDYAASQIPELDFYGPGNSEAIDQAMTELADDTAELTDADWQQNLYTSWLWTIRSLFGWQAEHRSALPQFMQSLDWEIKTLQTAAAWWTELRHATILYAKQSFAELGAGGPGCDERTVPPPPKSYIEPQAEAFARLSHLAQRTRSGLEDLGFTDLRNLVPLQNFIDLMDEVETYVSRQLANDELSEELVEERHPDYDNSGQNCIRYGVAEGSDWETLRTGLVSGLKSSLPIPTEGPVLSAKDRRAAIVADVHTGGDSANPTRILYEGTGVPYVIFTAVSDTNGPRLTVGFIYSQFEFTEPYGGQRLTDEGWQKNFYVGEDPYDAFDYAERSGWPTVNEWYRPLFR